MTMAYLGSAGADLRGVQRPEKAVAVRWECPLPAAILGSDGFPVTRLPLLFPAECTFFTSHSVIRLVAVFDDKAGLQPGYLRGQACGLDGAQDFVEILVGGRRFISGVNSAV